MESSSVNNDLIKLLHESHQRSAGYTQLLEDSNIRKLGPANMQAVLLQVEDFLDNNHIYSYKNWFDGYVYDGPMLKKYWVIIKLRYDYELMPDPQAIVRLDNLGVKVDYEEVKKDNQNNKDDQDHFWVVSLTIPKHLINIS